MDLEVQDVNEDHQIIFNDGAVDASAARNDIVPEDYLHDALKIYYGKLFMNLQSKYNKQIYFLSPNLSNGFDMETVK